MKALIHISSDPELFEVFPESAWHKWIDSETGAPLTDENFGYAMCYEFPEGDVTTALEEDFTITETERIEVGLDGEEKTYIYKIAEYHPPATPRQNGDAAHSTSE